MNVEAVFQQQLRAREASSSFLRWFFFSFRCSLCLGFCCCRCCLASMFVSLLFAVIAVDGVPSSICSWMIFNAFIEGNKPLENRSMRVRSVARFSIVLLLLLLVKKEKESVGSSELPLSTVGNPLNRWFLSAKQPTLPVTKYMRFRTHTRDTNTHRSAHFLFSSSLFDIGAGDVCKCGRIRIPFHDRFSHL